MFDLDTRVSTALAERPELRDLLPEFHPAFAKLKHPVLGRVMPRLVNIRDAARVAGVDPDALLRVMNLPGPPAHPLPSQDWENEPEPAWRVGATVQTLDLRPSLAQGQEPFGTVMGACRALPAGHVLELLTPFEPAPLRSLFGDRGWETHCRLDGDVFHTSFFRRPDRDLAPLDAADAQALRLTERDGVMELDVRHLQPPEPLRATLAALDLGHVPLRLLHRREPALLYPHLETRGLSWTTTTHGDRVWVVIDAA